WHRHVPAGARAQLSVSTHLRAMKRSVSFFLLLLSAAAYADQPAKLRWTNGEWIPGDFSAASASEVTWKSPLFEEPVVLAWPVVHRVDRQVASVVSPDSFGIALRDGSYVLGDLVSISDNSISIHSTRHGDAVLKRSEVLSIRRVRGGSLIAAGPVG